MSTSKVSSTKNNRNAENKNPRKLLQDDSNALTLSTMQNHLIFGLKILQLPVSDFCSCIFAPVFAFKRVQDMHHLEATARRINFDGSRLINICGGFSIRIEGKKTIVITESHLKELQKNTWVKSKRVYKNELNCVVVYRGHEESCNSVTVEAYLNGVSQAHDMSENEIDNLLMNGWDILEQCNENGSNELFFVDKFGPLSEDFGNGVISEGLLLQHFEESCIKPFAELSNYLGIFKPLYSFGVKNFFGLKINPLNLNIINILHYGAPKIWYIINNNPQNLNKFYGIVGSSVNEFFICSPHILDHYKICYAVIIQREGDVVFLRGGYPFFGFHCGVNFSSEIFYATPEWVKENLVSKQPGKMYKIKGELGQPLFSVAGDEESIRLAQVFNQWKIDYEQKDPEAIIKFNQLKKMIGKVEKNDTQAYNHLRKPIIKKVATPRKYTLKQKSQKATRRKKLREELRTLGFLTNKRKRAKRHVDKTISQSCIKMDENQIEMGTQSYLVDEEPASYIIENYGSNYGQQVAKQGIAPAYQDPCYSETDSHAQSSFQNFSALCSPSSSESGFSDSMHYGVSSECCRSNAPPSSNITLAELNSNHDNCYSPILNYVSYEPKTPEPEPKFVNFDYMNNEYDSDNLHDA